VTELTSPRIERLREALGQDGDAPSAAGPIAAFWAEVEAGGAPLVEPDPGGDPDWRLVTFLWRDAGPRDHVLHVEFWSGGQPRDQLLTPIPGTDAWYRTMRLPATMRGVYRFGPDDDLAPYADGMSADRLRAWRRDPFNPLTTLGDVPRDEVRDDLLFFDASLLELPGAAPLRWVDPPASVPAGTVTRHRLASEVLGNERAVWLYEPPVTASDHGTPLPLLVHFDGEWATDVMGLPRTLDAAIAAGDLPPLVAVLVGNADRNAELPPNDAFVAFLADEVLPWVRATSSLPVSDGPADTVVAGQSYGGLAASYAALSRPDAFGNVVAESASYWWLPDPASAMTARDVGVAPEWEWLPRWQAARDPVPIRWVLDVGILEGRVAPPGGPSLLSGVRHMRDVLTAQGAEIVRYEEFMGGHDPSWWRGFVVEGLVALLGNWTLR
jgi:enterochelin esterase-like enzyme